MKRIIALASVLALVMALFVAVIAPAPAAASANCGWPFKSRPGYQRQCNPTISEQIDDYAAAVERGGARQRMAKSGIYNLVARNKFRDANTGSTRNLTYCQTAAAKAGESPAHATVYGYFQAANVFYATGVAC